MADKIRVLKDGGISTRYMKKAVGPDTRGSSSSNVSRRNIAEARASLRRLQGRRFDDEPIVAAFLDGTAVGPRNRKETVMIVVGVTADGRKIALGAGITPGENSEDIIPLLRRIIRRGVDPGILWIADQGPGIKAALEAVTRPPDSGVRTEGAEDDGPKKFSRIQVCTTHASGNVVKALPKDTSASVKDDIRVALYGIWREDDPDIAEARLKSYADELEGKGFTKAADSLRGSMHGTVTVQRLGLKGELRRQLRSTNAEESINRSVKRALRDVTRWRVKRDKNGKIIEKDDMRLRNVANELLKLEKESWNRLANPEQLVEMMAVLGLDRHDPEAILAKLPPTMSVEPFAVSFGDDEQMIEIATEWITEHPDAAPIGSGRALEALGLNGMEVTPEVLLDAMRCRDPDDRGKSLRAAANVVVELNDGDDKKVTKKVSGIKDIKWKLEASPSAMREWHQGGDARARVEEKLKEAALAAVERVTFTTSDGHGFAGFAALRRPASENPEQPLAVEGIVVAVQRGIDPKKLGSPARDEMYESANLRAAEDVAKPILHGEPVQIAPTAPDVAPHPPAAARVEPAPIDPELLAAVRARALELAPRMVAATPGELEALKARLYGAEAGLSAIAGEVEDWQTDKRWAEAVKQLATARLWPAPSTGSRDGIWGSLHRGYRAVLGEKRSQALLGDVAFKVGRAAANPVVVPELRAAPDDALAGLAQPVARVQAAAEALAVRTELERRKRIEAARGWNARKLRAPPELQDSRGVYAVAPIDRYLSVLGPDRAMALRRYAEAIASEMETMDEAGLLYLAATSKLPWDQLVIGIERGEFPTSLERTRDTVLKNWQEQKLTAGQRTGVADVAAASGSGTAFIEADALAEAPRKAAEAQWEELRRLEEQLADRRQTVSSPEALVEKYSSAVIHHAAFAELSRRAQERGTDVPQVNRQGMATNKRSNTEPNRTKDRPTPPSTKKPLRDNLAHHGWKLGAENAEKIRKYAAEEAKKHGLGQMPSEKLRAGLPTHNPFASLPSGQEPDREALRKWWRANINDAVRVAAIEGELIERAAKTHDEVAKLEVIRRRGDKTPDAVAKVREARGEEYATKVRRHAAVLASELSSKSPQERAERTAARAEEIRTAGGLESANFDAIVEAVALQHIRNVGNVRETARLRDAAPDRTTGPDVAAAPTEVAAAGPEDRVPVAVDDGMGMD